MISNVKATEGIGDNILKKTIHKGSESIMFSVLQETQYMYPFKSSVREIVSNCLDSINERNNAVRIANGDIEIDDLFIEKEGSEFKESRFDSSYYNEKWLSDNNEVTIRYIENDTTTRDRIQFIDNGVGLGGDRLIKYFSLGFSTKRLSKSQLGSFGLGAKSLLATGVDFYSVTSRYNGREYVFNVFKDHVVSDIPKFNDDGTTNEVEKFYNDFETYYRKTTKRNGVIVEAEVKRHRKQDYVSAIENQLGYIDNINLLMSDKEYGIVDSKRNIKSNILFSTDKLLVGESDYYAKPQILLRPGDDPNIKISYGPINFDELEMKRYGGNVSFIMNINEVDVTPSRESVIWNTKTRNAIKNMFETAQETVSDLIKEKLSNETSLADHLALLSKLRGKNSMDGLAELYKVIDSSKINLKFRGFSINNAALELDDLKKTPLIFTETQVIRSWQGNKTKDTSYTSALANAYIAKLSTTHEEFKKITVYVGEVKYKDLARYINNVNPNSTENIQIIYYQKEHYDKITKDIASAGGVNTYLDNAYTNKKHADVLYGEVMRSIGNGMFVLKEEDIDKNLMKSLEEKEKEASTNNRYMTTAERAKLDNKVQGRVYSSGSYSYNEYYNEASIQHSSTNFVIYSNSDSVSKSILNNNSYYRRVNIPDNTKIIGFSEDNFKRFVKIEGVKTLTNSIYTIEFGDLKLTDLGRGLMDSTLEDLVKVNTKNLSPKRIKETILHYLENKFRDFKVNEDILDSKITRVVERMEEHRERGEKASELLELPPLQQ